jgi:hypothetical protein
MLKSLAVRVHFSSVYFSMLIIEIVVSRLQRQVGRPQSTATRSETTYLGRICQSYRLEQSFGVMSSYYTLDGQGSDVTPELNEITCSSKPTWLIIRSQFLVGLFSERSGVKA